MPFKYNPYSGEFDLTMSPGSGTATTIFDADTGSAVPDGTGTITIAGDSSGIDTSATGNTVTFSFDVSEQPAIATSVGSDSGTTTPALNTFTIAGGTGINTAGASDTLTINLDSPVTVANGGTGATTLTDHGILLGSGTSAVTALGEATNGQLPIGSTGADPVLASLTASDGIEVTNGAGSITLGLETRLRLDPSLVENIGFSYTGGTGTFSVESADGTAFSSSNPGLITLPDNTDFGESVLYTVTADQTFIDDAGASEIINNLFGLTTGVATSVDVPFFIYACGNDDQDALAFGISRIPNLTVAPSVANLGSASSATADVQGSLFLLNDPTLDDYNGNPVKLIGSFRMRMSASDDWTVQALSTDDGVGRYQGNQSFTGLAGQFGANSGTFCIPNGGTPPIWSIQGQDYRFYDIQRGIVEVTTVLRNDAGTDGSGAVTALLSVPFYSSYTVANIAPDHGTAFIINPTETGIGRAQVGNGANTLNVFGVANAVRNSQWGDYTAGGRNFETTVIYNIGI